MYIVLYGRKVKADPTKSYIYGNKVDFGDFDPENVPAFEKRHIPVAIVVVVSLLYMIYVAIFSDLSFHTSATIFLYMGLLAGIAYRMPVNEMCKQFCNGVKGMASTGILIGFAYAISGILSAGNVMDTVVNALANGLAYGATDHAGSGDVPHAYHCKPVCNFWKRPGGSYMPIFIPVATWLACPDRQQFWHLTLEMDSVISSFHTQQQLWDSLVAPIFRLLNGSAL